MKRTILYLASLWCKLTSHRTVVLIDPHSPMVMTYCGRCLGQATFWREPWTNPQPIKSIGGRVN